MFPKSLPNNLISLAGWRERRVILFREWYGKKCREGLSEVEDDRRGIGRRDTWGKLI